MVKTMLKKFLCIFFSLVVCCISLVVPCSYAFNEPEIPSVPDGYDVSWFDEEKAIDYIKWRFLNPSSGDSVDIDEEYGQYYTFGYSFYSGHKDKIMINAVFYSDLPSFTLSGSYLTPPSSSYKCIMGFFQKSTTNEFGIDFYSNSNHNIYALNGKEVRLYNSYSSSYWYSRTNLPSDLFDSYDLSYTDNVIFDNGGSSGGSVQVTFLPGFSMNMNGDLYNPRLAFGGSTSATGSHLSMIVESKLKNPIQIRMYITGKGEKFSLGEVSAGPTHTGFQNRNWNCDFIFMKEDWVFAPDISTGDTSNSRLQYKPTSWHYVDTYFNQSISWASINVIEDVEYDVVVEYVELTPDDIYADTTLATDDKIVECYRQTFSIYKRSVPYDPTNEDFGVLNIHGYDDYLTAENSSSGYVDDDGKTQIKNTLNVNPNLYGNGSSGSGSHQLYSGTNFSLTSLQMSTRNVLSFFQYVFGYFPSQVWNAFYFILVCIVVFAFIKLLKG